MNIKMFRLLALGLAALVAGCSSPTSDTAKGTTDGNAPTTLFADSSLTSYLTGASGYGKKVSIADLGGGATITTAVPAKAVFSSYPSWWDGGVGWAMKPATTSGYYDLSGVKSITFKIKSATILPKQLAFFLQWGSATAGTGNEYTLPLQYDAAYATAWSSTAKAAKGLGVASISSWTTVTVKLDSATGDVPDVSDEPVRYGYTANKFYTDDGAAHVDTPFAIKWYGSAAADPNSGSLTSGSYEIGDIRFLDAAGKDVAIAAAITWPAVPQDLAAAPTLNSADVIALYTSSSTYTPFSSSINWNPNWGQSGTLTDTTVAGKTLKLLDLKNYQGVDFASAVQDLTGKTKLHLSVWTHNGTAGMNVVAVNAAAGDDSYAADSNAGTATGTLTADTWNEVELDLPAGFHPNIQQLKFDTSAGAAGVFYLDNLYFH